MLARLGPTREKNSYIHGVLKAVAFIVLAAAVAGCASSDADRTATMPPGTLRDETTAAAHLARAPAWIRRYCADAGRTIKPPVLCPERVPRDISPTGNLNVFRPAPEGYIFEAQAETHWVFAAQPGDVEADYGPMRHLGPVHVRDETGRWLYAPETAGIHAGHLVLTWRIHRFHYTISAHTDNPSSDQLRDELLTVAEGMRLHR
jgi:hypothetical protein